MAVATKTPVTIQSVWVGPGGVDEAAWAAQIWQEKERVSAEVDQVRQIAYKIAGYKMENRHPLRRLGIWFHNTVIVNIFGSEPIEGELAEPLPLLEGRLPIPTDPDDIVAWAADIVQSSSELQTATAKAAPPDALKVVQITSRAGQLLGAVELLMMAYIDLLPNGGARITPAKPQSPIEVAPPGAIPVAAGNAPPAHPPQAPPAYLPPVLPLANPPAAPTLNPKTRAARLELLCHAKTEIEDASHQLLAAQGHAANLISRYGALELNVLMLVSAALFALYYLFHPIWGRWPAAANMRPTYEIFFWSMFGAIAMSALLIAQETMRGRFVPALMFKYVYRIPLAPLVAYVLIVFLSMAGEVLSGVGTTIVNLDPTSANYGILIVLAFLFGFFSKRSLEVLDGVWKAMMAKAPEGTAEVETAEVNVEVEGEAAGGGTKPAATQELPTTAAVPPASGSTTPEG